MRAPTRRFKPSATTNIPYKMRLFISVRIYHWADHKAVWPDWQGWSALLGVNSRGWSAFPLQEEFNVRQILGNSYFGIGPLAGHKSYRLADQLAGSGIVRDPQSPFPH